jgi:hypothetical protein
VRGGNNLRGPRYVLPFDDFIWREVGVWADYQILGPLGDGLLLGEFTADRRSNDRTITLYELSDPTEGPNLRQRGTLAYTAVGSQGIRPDHQMGDGVVRYHTRMAQPDPSYEMVGAVYDIATGARLEPPNDDGILIESLLSPDGEWVALLMADELVFKDVQTPLWLLEETYSLWQHERVYLAPAADPANGTTYTATQFEGWVSLGTGLADRAVLSDAERVFVVDPTGREEVATVGDVAPGADIRTTDHTIIAHLGDNTYGVYGPGGTLRGRFTLPQPFNQLGIVRGGLAGPVVIPAYEMRATRQNGVCPISAGLVVWQEVRSAGGFVVVSGRVSGLTVLSLTR